MASRFLKKNLDIALAVFIACGAVFVGVQAYAAIQSANKNAAIIHGLPKGRAEYLITQEGRCVGSIAISTTIARRSEISLSGSIHAATTGGSARIAASGTFDFNPLGQLVYGTGSLVSDSGKIEFDLRDAAPIEAALKAQSDKFSFSKNFSLPGPVIIKEDGGESVSFAAGNVSKKTVDGAFVFFNALCSSLGLRLERTDSLKAQCSQMNPIRGLDETLARLKGLVGSGLKIDDLRGARDDRA